MSENSRSASTVFMRTMALALSCVTLGLLSIFPQASGEGGGAPVPEVPPVPDTTSRDPDGDGIPKAGDESPVSGAGRDQLKEEMRRIFTSVPAGSALPPECLERIAGLVPRLKGAGMFWNVMGAVPAEQRPLFRDEIFTAMRNLDHREGSYVNPGLRDAYMVAAALRDPEVASIALTQLPREKPYVFPEVSPVKGWPTANDTEFLMKGNQGTLAAAVVEYGDGKTMEDYRGMLAAATGDTQRVMIWALGKSHRLADFELLLGLREKIQSPATMDTLIRALNRIPNSMEIVAKSPEVTSPPNRPAHPEELLATAEACGKRLTDMNLTRVLTFGD